MIILFIVFTVQLNAQTVSLKGRVTAARYSIVNASVTVIDNSDTTKKFSTLTDNTGNYQIGIPTSIRSENNNLPTKFELEQNYPNPFSNSTAIPYNIKEESEVQVTIYDILGREVRVMNAGVQRVGAHNLLWDGRNNFGQRVTSGVYLYRLHADGESQVRKMILNENSKGIISIPRNYSTTPLENVRLNKSTISEGSYTIRIGNVSTTMPIIISQEFYDVKIQRDTTINFTVNYIPLETVNFSNLRQLIRGFGAANILPWRPDMTSSEIETAFGTGDTQLGFSILRLMVQPDSNQWSMNVTTAKKAHEKGVLIFASPWNAPPRMTEVINGQTRVRYDMYNDYADHLNAYTRFMLRNGVPLYAISVQNEPDYANEWTGWTADEMLRFMKEYAHKLETRVMAPESFQFRKNMSDPILNDSIACSNLDIVGGHIYGGGLASYPLAEQKGKEVWMTEHLSGETGQANDWAWGLPVASEMNNVMKAGMNAYVWWYIVRFYGPISDGTNNSGNKGTITKKGYVMSQFSKFIRPGYYRVESAVYPPLVGSGVSTTSYIDPATSKVIIVAVNTSTTSKEHAFRIQNGTVNKKFTPYTTSVSKNCEMGSEINVAGDNFIFTLEPSSITTFVSN
ncbi:MAG: T9SS type A sorting domain-containing protein [Melioribacteraceae bacterium]|nr:T9SS type A sorting domain-containing protein [Melioribacteraceae bacterium]